MLIFYVLSAIVFGILVCLAFFSFSWLSPIPYFPSNKRDLPLIIQLLKLSSRQCIVDLGAGDGVVLFEAARQAKNKNLATEFIAVEVNPILLLVLFFRRLFHPNRKKIHIFRADMFSLAHEQLLKAVGVIDKHITYYLYISPWMIKPVVNRIMKSYSRPFHLVSYLYPLPHDVKRTVQIDRARSVRGFHTVYGYYTLRNR